jgi:hypothetical protein
VLALVITSIDGELRIATQYFSVKTTRTKRTREIKLDERILLELILEKFQQKDLVFLSLAIISTKKLSV